MPEGDNTGAAGAQQTAGQAPAAGQQQDGQQGTPPPWEANGQQFDPERAWKLIQNLQGERDGLRSERDTLRSTVSEHEQASMTELQRATQRAETAEGRLPTLESENTRLRAALSVGLTDPDLIDRLRGSTLDELVADAKALQQRLAPPQRRFDTGARQTADASDMNDLIFGGLRR